MPVSENKETVIRRVLTPGLPVVSGKRVQVKQRIPIPPRADEKGARSTKKLTREEWKAEYRKALTSDPAFHRALRNLPPRHAALLVAWATNGNNIQRAASQTNYSVASAKKIFKSRAFREARLLVEAFRPTEDKLWIDMLPEARITLRTLLKSDDDKVRYLAAKDIVDRAEGKPNQKIDLTVREEGPSMTDAEMQLAFSIMQQGSLGFAETHAWMRAHPDEVKEWIASNVKNPPHMIEASGSRVIDAEILDDPEEGDDPVSSTEDCFTPFHGHHSDGRPMMIVRLV